MSPERDPGDGIERDEALAILVEASAQLAADSPAGSAELGDVVERARSVLKEFPVRLSGAELARAAGMLELPVAYLGSARRTLWRRQAQLLAIGAGLTALLVLVGLAIARAL